MPYEIPLKVLVIDPNHDSVNILLRELQSVDSVILAHRVESLEQAGKVLAESDINAIFINPLSVELDSASDFIFTIREESPEIVFVLYIDTALAEQNRAEFYRGERKRFLHYFWLRFLHYLWREPHTEIEERAENQLYDWWLSSHLKY